MINQIVRSTTGILLLNLLWAQFTLQDGEPDRTVLHFSHGDVSFEPQGDYTKLIPSKGGTTTDYGQPELPLFSTLIQVESDKEYSVSYNIVSSHTVSDIKIFPFQDKDKTEMPGVIKYMDASFYAEDAVYPETILNVSDRLVMRDLDLLNISVVPYLYNPSQQTLEVIDEIEIEVTESGERDDGGRSERLPSRVFEKLYSTLVLNYEERSRDEAFQDPAILYICGGSSENNSSFQQLVEWRHQRGYVVYTASLSETGSSSSSIKNYIQNAYNNFSPPPEYVAFVGDVGGSYNVPTFYDGWGHNTYGDQCEGDQPYCQLDGNDLFPEIFIGRISIRSTTDLAIVVNKILHYEKGTYASSMLPYYEKAALIGDPSSSGISTAITNEYVEEILIAHGFEDVRIKTSGGSWSSWMQSQLNEGVLYFNYRGYLGVSGFGNSNIDAANNGHKLPLATVLTCGTGSFAEDQTSISEKFLRAGSVSNPKGGIAGISTATWNTHTLFNNIIDMGIYDGIIAKNIETAGGGLAHGKLVLLSAYPTDPYNWVSAFTQWNSLMGDPATHLWTDTPDYINVQFEENIPFGTNFLDVHVYGPNGIFIEDAMVTVHKGDDEIFFNTFTDQNGNVTLDLTYDYGGEVNLTITKQNYIPFLGSFEINTLGKLINLDPDQEVELDDGEDGNGILNPGETIDIQIPIKNFGLLSVTGLQATLESTSPYVTLTDNNSYYGTLNAGAFSFGDAFTLFLDPSAIDREDLGLRIHIMDDSGEEWVGSVPLMAKGGYLVVANDVFIEKNQTTDIPVSVQNNGSIQVENVMAELSYNGELIDIIDGDGSWGTIQPSETIVCFDCFTISAGNDMVNGTLISLAVQFYNSAGYDNRKTLTLQVGEVTESDPLGPDAYGYYIYDMEDTEYDFTPAYDWIEIDPGYGGSGTDLNLSDSGNGIFGNSSEIVDLPFTFRFYGIDYERITVNSNGWIAPGESDLESFRNYPIPGAGGPSPMIAAFWDDLKTTSGGDVFRYFDPSDQYVIIEWSDMRTQNQNSVESFQVILYNTQTPPFGDGDIKIQYKTFNNTSSGNFSGYPPVHGGYATIGIENHLSEDGLEYTFNNIYASAATQLDDGSALFITTHTVVPLPAPHLIYTPDNFNFTIGFNENTSESMILTNQGEPESILQYSMELEYPEAELPFSVSGGGPDGFGHYWGDSNITPELSFDWHDISETGQQLIFPHNDIAPDPIDIGFDFPYFGESYSQYIVNPNGWVGFGEDNTEYQNSPVPAPTSPRPAIFAFWDDLSPESTDPGGCPDQGGNVYVESFDDKLVIWFDDVIRCSTNYPGTYDFQVILHENGGIDINYNTMEGHLNSATIGMQNATGTDGLQIVFNEDYVQNELSLQFRKPANTDWLLLYSESNSLTGTLAVGEEAEFTVEVNSEGLSEGEYLGHINISSNEQPNVVIPVILNVVSGGEMTLELPYSEGWNLVGLPVSTTDNFYMDLFPDALEGTMYSFNQGYIPEEILVNGTGYWLRMASDGNGSVTGLSINQLEVSLITGWNIISGLSFSVDVNTIIDPQGIIVPFTYYGFDGSYVLREILEPGTGYWVRTSGEGVVEMNSEGLEFRSIEQNSFINEVNTLTLKNKNSNSIQLYFGVELNEEEKQMFSLPPVPPFLSDLDTPVLDVRFDNEYRICPSQGIMNLLSSKETEIIEFEIIDGNTWELTQLSGDFSVLLTGKGQINIPGNQSEFLLKKTDLSTFPMEFNLFPAFPNPFNPVTQVRFSVPQNDNQNPTSVNVYDLNGTLIETLSDGYLDAGYHQVTWNAGPHPSGMYFIRMQSGRFDKAIKTMLIK